MNTKVCIICKERKSYSEFNKGKYSDGLQNRCRDCGKKLFKDWYSTKMKSSEYRQKQTIKTKKWYVQNKDYVSKKKKEDRRKLRERVLKEYGNKCVCCGEKTYEFLGVDHIQNNGGNHRKVIGRSIYEFLIKENFPKNEYQILCHNCNLSKALYGICPHKRLEYEKKLLK